MKWPPRVRQTLRQLRALGLTDRPVRVRVRPLPADFAECVRLRDHYRITLSAEMLRNYPTWVARDALIHEFAHAVAPWREPREHHSNQWGLAYARLYRALDRLESGLSSGD